MKAVQFHRTGGPEVLSYEEVQTPSPKPGEVLIKIESIGVNYADTIRRRGDDYPDTSPVPFVLGVEVAGTIEALGEGVDSLKIGMSVFATPGAGGYAEYICLPAAIVIPLPDGIDFDQAAALVAHGVSAAIALKKVARIEPGEMVLIEGAAGGLGSFAVQLAKLYGAIVIAAASTKEKRENAIAMGADFTVDYTLPDWSDKVREFTGGKGVDVILETTGGEVVNQALDTLAVFGRMIYIGQSSGLTASIDPWRLTTPNHTISGIYINNFTSIPGLIMETLAELIGLILSGKIILQIGTILPLSQAIEAHKMLEGRKNIGKIILKPWI